MSKRRTALTAVAWAVLIALGVAAGLAVHRLWQFRSEIEKLADRLILDVGPESTLVYDSDNNLVGAVYEEHRITVRLGEMSPHLTNAVLVTEDRRFFDHDGIDLRRIVAAFVANMRAGEIVEGGSTITQQLVRSMLLGRDRTYRRKIIEAILARRLEERYSKSAILEAYLNRVYFGDGYYGIEAASIGYFGKPAARLSPGEAAMLAGVIKGPSVYSPTKNPQACKERRDIVLTLMHEDGMLSDEEFETASQTPVKAMLVSGDKTGVPDPRHAHGAEYFRDAVTRELIDRFGADAVYTGGLRVYTTLDRNLQRLGETVIATRLRGLSGGTDPLQGALVAIDPQTGFVKAIVGGHSFHETPYNRAIEARRQPGSAFKPFIFAAALESGLSPGSQLDGLDEPILTQQGPWLPNGEHETIATNLRTALALSSNRAAAHLLQEVGIHRTLDLVQRMGISSPLPAVPALALGTGEVTLYELTSAYSVFANRGVWKEPTLIRRVVDRSGREVYAAPGAERRVLSEATAYMMASMMSDVLDYGTAASARAQGFKLHAAGKTGTSQEYTDAWFVGFTPNLATGVWFGFDKPGPIMDRGFASVVAVPAWVRFMSGALRGYKDQWFDMPGSLVKVKICRLSGMLATDKCQQPVYELGPYDPNHPEMMLAGGRVREASVYEEMTPADRIPPPCTLAHGVPLDTMPTPDSSPYSAPSSDPAPIPPSVQRAGGTDFGASQPAAAAVLSPPPPAARSNPIDPSGPVTAPPAFMLEKPAPRVMALPPPAAPAPKPEEKPKAEDKPKVDAIPKAEDKPKPDESLRPIIPGAPTSPPTTTTTPPPAQDGPIIPGSRVEKAPPAPPAPRRPPQVER